MRSAKLLAVSVELVDAAAVASIRRVNCSATVCEVSSEEETSFRGGMVKA